MAEATRIRVRGNGGGEFVMDLPLSNPIADQLRRGDLTPLDDAAEAEQARLQGREVPAPALEPAKAKGAPKAKEAADATD